MTFEGLRTFTPGVTCTTASSPVAPNNVGMAHPASKVQFIGYTKDPYSTKNYFTLGFWQIQNDIAAIDGLMRSIFGHTSRVVNLEGRLVAELIRKRFNVSVDVIEAGPSKAVEEIVIRNFSKMREIIQWLEDKRYLSTSDRASLNPLIAELERVHAYHSSVTASVSQAQIDIIESFAQPYVEGILEGCRGKTTSESLSTWPSASFMEPIDQKTLAFALLITSCQGHIATVFLEILPELGSLLEDAEILQKLYSGTAQLEGAFGQSGVGVPSLQQQRSILFAYFAKKVGETFGANLTPVQRKIMKNTKHLAKIEGEFQSKSRGERRNSLAVQINDRKEILKRLEGERKKELFLDQLSMRLFAEGFHLDLMPYTQPIQFHAYNGVIDVLKGNFGTESFFYGRRFFSPSHGWRTPEGLDLQEDAARERFAVIRNEVAQSLGLPVDYVPARALPAPASSGPCSSLDVSEMDLPLAPELSEIPMPAQSKE